MKRKIIFLALLSLVFFTTAFQKYTVATIAGEIQKYDKTPLLIIDYKIKNTPDTIPVVNGKFKITMPVENAGFKYLLYGQDTKEIFLAPGYLLRVSFNATNVNGTIKYAGQGATENLLLDSLSKVIHNSDLRFAYARPTRAAKKYIDSLYNAYQKYFEKLTVSKKVNPIFIAYEKQSLVYSAAAQKTIIGLQNNIKDPNYYSFFDSLTIENDKYLDIASYRMFLNFYLGIKVNSSLAALDSSLSKLPGADQEARLAEIEKIKNKKVKEYLAFITLNERLLYNGVNDVEKLKLYFDKTNTDSVYAQQIRKNYLKKLLLAPGRPAPSFTCTDRDNIKHSLNDFKGKYVYIDFWTTWCGPCRQELPSYLTLQADYKDKNIVFVSISIDGDKKSWENVVKDTKHGGINLIGNNGWYSDVAKAYQIVGVPTFVLIDKDGRIISSQAPRPSSGDIRKTLDGLLNK